MPAQVLPMALIIHLPSQVPGQTLHSAAGHLLTHPTAWVGFLRIIFKLYISYFSVCTFTHFLTHFTARLLPGTKIG